VCVDITIRISNGIITISSKSVTNRGIIPIPVRL